MKMQHVLQAKFNFFKIWVEEITDLLELKKIKLIKVILIPHM